MEPQQTVKAFSNIGWTYERSVQEYGLPTDGPWVGDDGKTTCEFQSQGYTIAVSYLRGTAGMVGYRHAQPPPQPVDDSADADLPGRAGPVARAVLDALDHPVAPLSQKEVDFFIAENCPNTIWTVKHDGATEFWSGTVDGREMYRVGSGITGLTIETVDWADHLTAREIWFKLTH